MHPLLAWLPFLAALLVAFAAGVAFARVNERVSSGSPQVPSRRAGFFGHGPTDVALSTAAVALMVGTLLVWIFVALVVLHVK